MRRTFLLLFVVLLPMIASAYDSYIGGIYYNFSGNNATVTYKVKYDHSYSGNVVIPSSVTYNGKSYSVTSIGDYAFYECRGLTSITIPNSVVNIGVLAFSSCEGLTAITIPNSVINIEYLAFNMCENLESITMGSGIKYIGDGAFWNCKNLKKVIVSDIANWCNVSFDFDFYGYGYSNPLVYAEHLYRDVL